MNESPLTGPLSHVWGRVGVGPFRTKGKPLVTNQPAPSATCGARGHSGSAALRTKGHLDEEHNSQCQGARPGTPARHVPVGAEAVGGAALPAPALPVSAT